ncbi:MAG: peptidoglycan DD-metalloendopeptidase family protein [Rickettsiales bacterium]|nr:peptidoglycan DD-metalloendopeptidase family protein [Rickettsiales bacterium]
MAMNLRIFGKLKMHCIMVFALCFAPYALLAQENCKVAGTEQDAPALCGVAEQGGMLYGEAKGWDVYSDSAKISMDDVFVIGLDRDAPDTLRLKFCRGGDCKTYAYPIKRRQYIEQNVTVPDKFIKYPKDVEDRIDHETAKVQKARAGALTDTALYFMEFKMPDNLKKYRISSVFGSRRVFNGQPKSPHKGLDFAAPSGTPVYPIAAGTVILAENHYLNGNIILVSHGHGVVSAYLHLDKIIAGPGDSVGADDILGNVGDTGRSSGAHLHLGLYHNQIAIDPAFFISKVK